MMLSELHTRNALPAADPRLQQPALPATPPHSVGQHSRQQHPEAARRSRPSACVLSVATHNIRSGVNDVAFVGLLREWRNMRFHVVCVQELHVQHAAATHLVALAAHAGFHMLFAVPDDGGTTAGVAILVDLSLLRAGTVVLHETAGHRRPDGRMLTLPLDWGGHKLLIANCYVPNVATEARTFLEAAVQPVLAETAGRQMLLSGDWNFVLDVSLDRVRSEGANVHGDGAQRRTQSDTACADIFGRMTSHMVDVFRHRCPHSRCLSFFGVHGGARLDRIYVPNALMPSVCSASIVTVDGSFSDHRAACMKLLATPAAAMSAVPARPAAARRRVRLDFWGCGVLRLQFEHWLQAQLACIPAHDHDLLPWWQAFKTHLAAEVLALNRQRLQQADPPHEVHARRLAAKRDMDAAMAAFEGGDQSALPRVLAHRRAWAAALAAAQKHVRVHGPQTTWLHANERPSPAFTAALSPARRMPVVAGIRHPANGRLVPPGAGQADIMARHYAAISAAAPRDAQAEEVVLAALPEHGPVGVPPEAVAQLGDAVVREEEVVAALKRSPPGRAPGWDGIPVEVYRKCGALLVPVLARLFTAIGRTGCLPRGFTKGLIVSLHKGGEVACPHQYRPITLLNADYRLLAKVLTNRLLPVAGQLISPEQSAFLPGRHIGEGIMLLQLIPHALAAAGHAGGAVVFLDFAKAYDTVSRPFLLRLLHAFGLGPSFGSWVSVLLSNTKASATMSGFTSSNVLFAAGVRQGCPLSPVLYLFVAEAMLRLLKTQPQLGMQVGGRRLVAQQFADDTKVFLRSDRDMDSMLSTMDIFRRASGEALNVGKCALLPIGPPRLAAPAAGTQVHGVTVKHVVDSHGFSFACHVGEARPAVAWAHLLERLYDKFSLLARMPLSVFGRASGATAYALSLMMYTAEFTNTLPHQAVADLQRRVAHLVDRKLGTGFTYVRGDLLQGPAKTGGMGVLPVQPHIDARRAVWAVRLLLGDAAKPWVHVGRFVLQQCWGSACPWHVLLPSMPDTLANHPEVVLGLRQADSLLPGPLSWLFSALHTLPSLRSLVHSEHDASSPGPMSMPASQCCHVPLFGNPFIMPHARPADSGPQDGYRPHDPLPSALRALAGLGIHTLGRLLQMSTDLTACADDGDWQRTTWLNVGQNEIWHQLLAGPHSFLRCREGALACVGCVLQCVPHTWVQQATQAQAAGQQVNENDFRPVLVQDVAASLLQQLSWPAAAFHPNASGGSGGPPHHGCSMQDLSVKVATNLLLRPVQEARHLRWHAFVVEAEGQQNACFAAQPMALGLAQQQKATVLATDFERPTVQLTV